MGATGPVGRIATQVARLTGARRVVALGRDQERLAELADLGATHVVAMGSSDDEERVCEATAGQADVVLDLVFGPPLVAALKATKQGGRVVAAGASSGLDASIPFAALRGKQILTYSNQLADLAPKRVAYRRLLHHLRRGHLRVDPQLVPMAQVAAGWRLQANTTGTKIVVSMREAVLM